MFQTSILVVDDVYDLEDDEVHSVVVVAAAAVVVQYRRVTTWLLFCLID